MTWRRCLHTLRLPHPGQSFLTFKIVQGGDGGMVHPDHEQFLAGGIYVLLPEGDNDLTHYLKSQSSNRLLKQLLSCLQYTVHGQIDQLQTFLEDTDRPDSFQSGFRPYFVAAIFGASLVSFRYRWYYWVGIFFFLFVVLIYVLLFS